jgi:hypothetical protein
MAESAPRVYVDFNNCDHAGRARLNTVGTMRDVKKLGIELTKGMHLLLYSEDLEALGVVQFSDEDSVWVASFSWDDLRERPSPPS